jgi:hypothetical protein
MTWTPGTSGPWAADDSNVLVDGIDYGLGGWPVLDGLIIKMVTHAAPLVTIAGGVHDIIANLVLIIRSGKPEIKWRARHGRENWGSPRPEDKWNP